MSDSNVTLRDEFAKAIIPALIATAADPRLDSMVDGASSLLSAARSFGWCAPSSMHGEDGELLSLADLLACEAFDIADAMMKERERVLPPVEGTLGSSPSIRFARTHDVPDVPQSTPHPGPIPGASHGTPTEAPAAPSTDMESSGGDFPAGSERECNPGNCRCLQQQPAAAGSVETPDSR